MNRLKRRHLNHLNRLHDEAYAALLAAQDVHQQARELALESEVLARHENTVAMKRAALELVEKERDPLLREHERHTLHHRERFRLKLAVAGLILSVLGNLAQWLHGT